MFSSCKQGICFLHCLFVCSFLVKCFEISVCLGRSDRVPTLHFTIFHEYFVSVVNKFLFLFLFFYTLLRNSYNLDYLYLFFSEEKDYYSITSIWFSLSFPVFYENLSLLQHFSQKSLKHPLSKNSHTLPSNCLKIQKTSIIIYF